MVGVAFAMRAGNLTLLNSTESLGALSISHLINELRYWGEKGGLSQNVSALQNEGRIFSGERTGGHHDGGKLGGGGGGKAGARGQVADGHAGVAGAAIERVLSRTSEQTAALWQRRRSVHINVGKNGANALRLSIPLKTARQKGKLGGRLEAAAAAGERRMKRPLENRDEPLHGRTAEEMGRSAEPRHPSLDDLGELIDGGNVGMEGKGERTAAPNEEEERNAAGGGR